jgi:hemoglobin/transferrin/lactoferrin receptor protein
LFKKSQQGGGSPSIRGFEASRVLLLVDGVRMNNLIFRAGHQNVITVDESMLDNVGIFLVLLLHYLMHLAVRLP